MNRLLDCVIIGAGPSGLTAGMVLADGNLDFVVVERGNFLYDRNPNIPNDIVSGVGGGGLFSDGKVSFFPSGSKLYKLDSTLLKKGYERVEELFREFSVAIPTFSPDWCTEERGNLKIQNLALKEYDSILLSQDLLYRIGFALYDKVGRDRVLIRTDVTRISFHNGFFSVEIYNHTNEASTTLTTKQIIFAAGKFGAFQLPKIAQDIHRDFRQFEFGIRIETEPSDFDYQDINQTDVKLLIQDPILADCEFRTFCFCRNGYIVHGKFEDIDTWNGVSNRTEYKMTNFGLNLRINDESAYLRLADELIELQERKSIIDCTIKEFIERPLPGWSPTIQKAFVDCLVDHFPKLVEGKAKVTGPSFEYFGYYPKINDQLKISNLNIWVSGDSTGRFRGLLPGLVSGAIAAHSLIGQRKAEQAVIYDAVRLKQSSTKELPAVFTAHSKKYFYCKDAICEFTFLKGYVPLNPFQTFGYFLNDRVDRELVRNGNNELIRRSDELWVFGSIADGVLFEIARANELNMPVRFFSIAAIADEIEEITNLNGIVFEPEVHARIRKEDLIKFISQNYLLDGRALQLKIVFDETA